MFEKSDLEKMRAERKNWETHLQSSASKNPWKTNRFSTLSGHPVKDLYTPLDIEQFDYSNQIGFPGTYPFTRGVYPAMYRERPWTMRMFAGLGSGEDTNRRFRFLVDQGQTGLSVAFDMPTIMGYDSDDPKSRGECGRCGVAVDTLRDMEILFHQLPIDKITTSMTINPPAAVIWAMYLVMAERRGINWQYLGGTIQNDMLKEFIAQKTFMCPPKASMRLIVDTIEFAARHVPKWNPISISGYHIREAGSTAVQELAFTLADGIAYVEASLERGLDVDAFAPRLSFFFNSHLDFFEEIAKFRAARRMWAKIMKERFKAKDPRSLLLRFHTQTAGCSLTAQQPYNNLIRTTLEALAAVLAGTQSLHTNALDEVLGLPTEASATLALRTQQIIAEESGVTHTIDPLGGSYFVERLTNDMEEEAFEYIDKIDEMGGMVAAIDQTFPQREIAEAAYRYQQQIDRGERTVVGVNRYVTETEPQVDTFQVDSCLEKYQIEQTCRIKEHRNRKAVQETLERLGHAAQKTDNLMYPILDAVREYATEQEICDVLRKVFGEYKDPGIY